MGYAKRVDANQAAIVEALKRLGWHVHDTSRLGGGFVDLVIARRGVLRLVEVKDGSKPPSAQAFTKAEENVRADFALAGVQVLVLTSVAEAVAL
jgi:hypothetical protein